MKRLLLLSMVLCFFAGCGEEETTIGARPDDPAARYEPHFYGAAMLENPAPATRGVANQLKVWNNTFAQNLTVKFLNGDPAYQTYVQEIVKEWEHVANVKFKFVDPSQKAIVRVAFNYNPTMMCSWALTGTDHLQVMNNQEEPTVNFSWRRAADAQKRSDVLRAFGQVLGLELEFRHPNCHPTWITDSEGNINEAEIRTYWESELGNYITWEELKKMVLDPLEDETFFIVSTPEYDSKSVMNWPFYRQLDEKLPYIRFDTDYNTELSEQDIQFVRELYGKPDDNIYNPKPKFMELVSFDSDKDTVRINLTYTKNLRIAWDESEYADIEVEAVASVDTLIHYVYQNTRGQHHISIAEVIPHNEEIPAISTALTRLDLEEASQLKAIDIKLLNKGLEYIRIIGGESFTPQNFSFTDLPNLSHIFLVALKDSKVEIKNCPKLGVVSTEKKTPVAWILTPQINFTTKKPQPVGGTPATPHSLSYLSIVNCPNIHSVALVNTHLQNVVDLSTCKNLTLFYLTSEANYIADGNTECLKYTLSSLPNRKGTSMNPLTKGQVFLRRIEISPDKGPRYIPWENGPECEIAMMNCYQFKNWEFIYPDLDGQYDWIFIGKPA